MSAGSGARWVRWGGTRRELGGKAGALAELAATGLPIPEWFAVSPHEGASLGEGGGAGALPPALVAELEPAVRRLAPAGELLAVRSSALDEDGAEHSFAGQFESFLYVRAADVPARVADVWRQAASERVAAYRRERGIDAAAGTLPAVLVQRMVDPDAAGVAFSADPVSGRRGVCVVSAAYGVGSALVAGDVDADTYHVARDGAIVHRLVAAKPVAHRAGPDGPREVSVPAELASRPALTDDQVRAVAALARDAERLFGRPQDVEWALAGGRLYLLQSRPVTSLAALPDPDGAVAVWDNSNIAESYGGVTTPLTFSFARYVYEEVYRQFCGLVGVPARRIEENADALRAMLGLVRGRVYYNLVSWHRLLALLPGYQLNRPFMEQMMGVREGLPPDAAPRLTTPTGRERLADAGALVRTVWGLVRAHGRLPRSMAAFHARLDAALATSVDLGALRADELVAHYRGLERQLLRRWDAPLVNDFFAMIHYGVLRKLAASWCGDAHGTLQNDLVSGEGTIVSAEPARRITRMAALASGDSALVDALCDGDDAAARRAAAAHPALAAELDAYVAEFGDRCLEELKLETLTLGDDRMLLVRSVGRLARARAAAPQADAAREPAVDFRAAAEREVEARLAGSPVRRRLFRWVLGHARARVRDRENLRFERTRVFGRVRRVFVELGRRYAAAGALDDPRDVFYLTVDEALGWPDATAPAADLRALAAARRAEFARYDALPAPADRFVTRGIVHAGHDFAPPAAVPRAGAAGEGAELRRGTGCYPGVVRGTARVILDPRGAALHPGEILVAERTDPGWVMLFPAARGLLVERGSLLSHSAIVARELGLPAVVSVEGLTRWLATGDEVELDGRTGEIRRLRRAGEPAAGDTSGVVPGAGALDAAAPRASETVA